jgi:hypothetical protein
MVSAWKESGKLKDLKIEELNFQLGQAAAQLEATKQEAAALQQQLADSTSKVGIGGRIEPLWRSRQLSTSRQRRQLPMHRHH